MPALLAHRSLGDEVDATPKTTIHLLFGQHARDAAHARVERQRVARRRGITRIARREQAADPRLVIALSAARDDAGIFLPGAEEQQLEGLARGEPITL